MNRLLSIVIRIFLLFELTLLVQPMYRLMVSLLFSFRIHLYFKKGIYTIVLLASFPKPFSIIFIYLTEKINA